MAIFLEIPYWHLIDNLELPEQKVHEESFKSAFYGDFQMGLLFQ